MSQPKPNAESVLRFGVFAPDVPKRYGSMFGLRGESGLRVDCVHYRPRDFVFGYGATVVEPFDGDVEKHSRIKVRRVFVGVGIIAGKGDGKKAVIDNKDAKELSHNAYGKRVAELAELKRIIANAAFLIQTDDVEHNKFKAFRYYEALTKYKGNTSRIVLNVGVEKANEKLHLYSITNHPKDK